MRLYRPWPGGGETTCTNRAKAGKLWELAKERPALHPSRVSGAGMVRAPLPMAAAMINLLRDRRGLGPRHENRYCHLPRHQPGARHGDRAAESFSWRPSRKWFGTRILTWLAWTWSCCLAALASVIICAAAPWPPDPPMMRAVHDHAAHGGYILGVCNGFQILTEAGILPGAPSAQCKPALSGNGLLPNGSSDADTSLYQAATRAGQTFRAVMAHGDGNYYRR